VVNDDTIRLLVNDGPRTRWLFAGLALFGLALFVLATGVLMAPYAPRLGDRLGELTCLQLAFTGERAAAVLGSFDPGQRAAIARLLAPGDLVFAFGYGCLLAGLLNLLVLRLPDAWRGAGAWLAWAPLAASVFDCFEDAFMYAMTVSPDPAHTGLAPLLGGVSATLKYVLLSGVTPAFGIAGSVAAARIDRRPGSLLLYALVVLFTASMLAKPLQDVPPCFN
jgi:hypothetical protein